MNFTYEANAEGYQIFWNDKPLGGAGIIGKYRGKKHKEQVASYGEQARACVEKLKSGAGPQHMLDTLSKYRAEEQTKRHTAFLDAYINAAFWTSYDDNEMPFDEVYRVGDLSGELMDQMIEDCAAFLAKADIPDNLLPQAGHDFWLTRNWHGSGFWDRPEIYGEEKAQELSALAETFGVVDLYVGDDGRIYG